MTRNPSRSIEFDARSHHIDRKMVDPQNLAEVSSAPWEYGVVGNSNLYSITLPSKACFVRRGYLDLYTAILPRPIHAHIAKQFECEDIAMSYFVPGKPP